MLGTVFQTAVYFIIVILRLRPRLLSLRSVQASSLILLFPYSLESCSSSVNTYSLVVFWEHELLELHECLACRQILSGKKIRQIRIIRVRLNHCGQVKHQQINIFFLFFFIDVLLFHPSHSRPSYTAVNQQGVQFCVPVFSIKNNVITI